MPGDKDAERGTLEVRQVKLPAGWEGLSLKLDGGGRLIVSEVPKACFSSAAFGAGAKPQVDGVAEGDEIALLNGVSPAQAVQRIVSSGDPWNACSSCTPPHAVGSKGKFDSPPCASCDFVRRRKQLGLAVGLQMWLRAVKRDIQIVLGVRSELGPASPELLESGPHIQVPERMKGRIEQAAEKSSVVDLAATSSVTGSIAELKSLDDHTGANKKVVNSKKKKGKGKGKGKDKGKAKATKRPSGPDLPRTRLELGWVGGECIEWKGSYGWVRPAQAVDHPLAGKHKGRLYLHSQDLPWADSLSPGQACHFYVFSDASGLGAEECVVDEDWDWEAGEEEEGEGDEDEAWNDNGQDGSEWQ